MYQTRLSIKINYELFWRENNFTRQTVLFSSHTGNRGRRLSLPLSPPLELWRRFQSMEHVDRVMIDAAYDRIHQN
jgi:hypothetical protein